MPEDLSLGQKQRLFSFLLPRLLDKAHELGFEISLGEAWRNTATARLMAEQRRGIANSLHIERLAIDLNLFRGGEYVTDGDCHAPLGEFWESLHRLCRWGGRFGDGNHYSITHNGRK